MLNTSIIFLLLTVCVIRGLQTFSGKSKLEAMRYAKAQEIRKYINQSANPCENFFEFACGNWKTHHPASSGDWQTAAYFRNMAYFDRIISGRFQTMDRMYSQSERKVYEFYNSCMNFTTERSDFKDKVKNLANEFFQMPALAGDKWQEDQFDWLQTVAEIYHKYEIQLILSPDIILNVRDHNSYDIVISNGSLIDETEFASETVSLKDYLHKYLDVEIEETNKIVKETLDFEKVLTKAILNETIQNETLTVQEIHDKYYPDLDIKRLMNISFGYIPDGDIINKNPKYLENLIEIMKTTPKYVVANYISIWVIDEFLSDIDKMDQTLQHEDICVDETKEYFADILSKMFYRTNNLKEKEQYMTQMWQEIKANFQMRLESSALNWFDEKSREFALEKLHSVKLVVPSYQDKNLDEVYGRVHLNVSDYLENLKSLEQFETQKFRAMVNGTVQHIDRSLNFVSAYYEYAANTIVFPVSEIISGFLTSPFYPKAYNYGRLGFLLSHEVVHGFSANGRHYNKRGDKIGDWEKDFEVIYKMRVKCLYDQYTNYTFVGKNLFQPEDQSENIADNVGILLAYQGYRKWLDDKARTKEEIDMESFPDLKYTSKQLFFISYSQTFCADSWEEKRSELSKSDEHSLDEIRAFAPLTNYDDFSKEFMCPKGSPMNPIKKCAIY